LEAELPPLRRAWHRKIQLRCRHGEVPLLRRLRCGRVEVQRRRRLEVDADANDGEVSDRDRGPRSLARTTVKHKHSEFIERVELHGRNRIVLRRRARDGVHDERN